MKSLERIHFSAEKIESLRRNFIKLDRITKFEDDLPLTTTITCYGIMREIGGPNDELARFIFALDKNDFVDRSSMRAEMIQFRSLIGVRIWSTQSSRLEIRTPCFKDLLHPDFSYNDDGSIRQLVIFPEIISRLAKFQDVETVIVKDWAMNTIFGGFNSSKEFYQTNFWELENNDALLFSDLVRQRKIAFLGTHDLIAHICGIQSEKWDSLVTIGNKVFNALSEYFKNAKRPTILALILPYTIGVVLDDLAQPPTYDSKSHILCLKALIEQLETRVIAPDLPTLLTEFPSQFEQVIRLSRNPDVLKNPQIIKQSITKLVEEMLSSSLHFTNALG